MTSEQSQSQALVPVQVEPPRALLPTRDELAVIGMIARSVVNARGHAVPKDLDSAAKAAAVMLAGHELGLKPMTALRHIFVVNGRTEPDAQVMAGILIAREPDARLDVVELTADRCTMRLERPSRGIRAEYTYSIDDAKRADLLRNTPWQRHPKDMLRWAATKRLLRAYAPDLVNSVGAVDVAAAGELVEEVASDSPGTFIEAGGAEPDVVEVPPARLYNAGDVPEGVDPETGEILDDAAAAARPEPVEGAAPAPQPEPEPEAAVRQPRRGLTREWSDAYQVFLAAFEPLLARYGFRRGMSDDDRQAAGSSLWRDWRDVPEIAAFIVPGGGLVEFTPDTVSVEQLAAATAVLRREASGEDVRRAEAADR